MVPTSTAVSTQPGRVRAPWPPHRSPEIPSGMGKKQTLGVWKGGHRGHLHGTQVSCAVGQWGRRLLPHSQCTPPWRRSQWLLDDCWRCGAPPPRLERKLWGQHPQGRGTGVGAGHQTRLPSLSGRHSHGELQQDSDTRYIHN